MYNFQFSLCRSGAQLKIVQSSAFAIWVLLVDSPICSLLAGYRRRLVAGVATVPVSAFYQNDPPHHFARFSFCKEDATLDEALKRMRAFFGR